MQRGHSSTAGFRGESEFASLVSCSFHIWLLAGLLILTGIPDRADASKCDDPGQSFSSSLEEEIADLEFVLGKRARADTVTNVIEQYRQNLCDDLQNGVTSIEGAVTRIRLAKSRLLYCEGADTSNPSNLAKQWARDQELLGDRYLLAIQRFCGRTSDPGQSGNASALLHDLDSEFFCIKTVEVRDMLPIFPGVGVADFPPIARLHAAAEAACERLKSREIDIDTARYEMQKARLRERARFWNSEAVVTGAYFVWSAGHFLSEERPYYWGFMSILGTALFLVSLLLVVLGDRLDLYWMEDTGAWIMGSYGALVVLSVLFQLDMDSYSDLFDLVAKVLGVVSAAVAAVFAVRKLLRKRSSR